MVKKTKVVICTTSKDKETLISFSKSMDFQVVEVLETKGKMIRHEYLELLNFISENNIQKVIITNCLSLSPKVSEFLMAVNDLAELRVSILIYKEKVETLLPNGKVNPKFQLVYDILKEFDTAHRQLTKNRLHRGLSLFKAKGGQIGRKKGYRKNRIEYQMDYAQSISLLKDGYSLKKCHNITGTSINTLRKLKRMFV